MNRWTILSNGSILQQNTTKVNTKSDNVYQIRLLQLVHISICHVRFIIIDGKITHLK